jgi:hypothetical protein
MHKKTLFTLGLGVAMTVQGWGQVRQDLYSLTPAEQTTLATLVGDYVDKYVVATHAFNMPMVHSNPNFLPFHRAYVQGLEDYLTLRGYPQFVPLPKWLPQNEITTTWQTIDPACAEVVGGGICEPLVNVTANIGRALPTNFIGSNLCTYDSQTNLGYALEHPWHNNVHTNIAGAMSAYKSPAAIIFWPWHADVDDVWKEWECRCQGAPAVDLWMRDTKMKLGLTGSTMNTMSMDQGLEPNTQSDPDIMWVSEDIWVRNDGMGLSNDQHQNPYYVPGGSQTSVYAGCWIEQKAY